MKNLKYYLNKALKEKFALGAFNFSNMESLQAISKACSQTQSPAFISVSEGALNYMGENYVIALAKCAKEISPYLFLHLDHGKNFDICKKAIDLGFDSVMIDGSSLPFEQNINLTKQVCEYAHNKYVLVEGELGQIKGIEDNVSSTQNFYTDPEKAKIFVKETNVDLLAISIGTSHGAYKYNGEQTLRFDILKEIEKQLPNFPLVLHGASTIDSELINMINDYGGNIKNAKGVSKEHLIQAIKEHNIIKINTDSDIRLAFTSMTRKVLNDKKEEFDPRKYLGEGRNKAEDIIKDKIKNIFFSENKL